MTNHKSVLMAVGAAVLALVTAASAQGWVDATGKTYLTFSGPVALPGVTLRAGTYIFERADAGLVQSVRVLRRDRSIVFFTATTTPAARPAGLSHNRPVTFREAQAGAPPRIDAWFPVDEYMGLRFIYDR